MKWLQGLFKGLHGMSGGVRYRQALNYLHLERHGLITVQNRGVCFHL